jgi:hypothetical protein
LKGALCPLESIQANFACSSVNFTLYVSLCAIIKCERHPHRNSVLLGRRDLLANTGERFGDENGHQLGTTGPILNGIKRYVWQIFLQYKDCRQISSAMLPGPIWEVSNCGLSERLACEATRFKKRNISATIVADVKRFSHQINTGEVFDTHRSSIPRPNGF